jgi:hypothetical protein
MGWADYTFTKLEMCYAGDAIEVSLLTYPYSTLLNVVISSSIVPFVDFTFHNNHVHLYALYPINLNSLTSYDINLTSPYRQFSYKFKAIGNTTGANSRLPRNIAGLSSRTTTSRPYGRACSTWRWRLSTSHYGENTSKRGLLRGNRRAEDKGMSCGRT